MRDQSFLIAAAMQQKLLKAFLKFIYNLKSTTTDSHNTRNVAYGKKG